MPQTLYDKLWAEHLVYEEPDGTCLLYVDRHLIHEVDSPQAFGSLRSRGLSVKSPEKTLLVVDHNIPTSDRTKPNPDPESAAQIAYMAENARLFGLEYFDERDPRQGICHIVGPEQGFTLPGTMIVCGDSHATTHGAFGALACGIGTSEVEHVLATQTLIQRQVEEHARNSRRQIAADRQCERPDPLTDRRARCFGCCRPRGRVLRRDDSHSHDGRPHDGLQHGGGGRCAHRDRCAG